MKSTQRISGIGIWLLVAAHSPALGEQSPSVEIPPVERASFHQLMFADEDIAILNNYYPPSADSGFHAHYHDILYVIIQPSDSSVQNVDKPLTAALIVSAGTAGYSSLGGERRVHRVVNGDKSSFQIIVTEIRRASPSGNAISSRESVPQYVQIVDNPRVRAWRLILEPGQSVPAITQGNKGVRVVVRGGLLATITAGEPNQILALQPGDFAVQHTGLTRALSNNGTQTIELIEMELK